MSKFLMIQLQQAPYAGTAYLNGAVKQHGHKFSLHLFNPSRPEELLTTIKNERPDLIGFSCMTGFHFKALACAKLIKSRHSTPIIMGGPHATLFPDVINDPSIDMICRGEGEFALVELLNAIENRTDYTQTQNLWIKTNYGLCKNALRPLADQLDSVPLIDWSCYANTPIQNSSPIAFLIRGCPYSCTYCFNESVRNMYQGLGRYVRAFSVKRSIQEIKAALGFFNPSPVLFTSDTFGTDIEWMRELLDEYDRITSLPFVVLLRPELVSEKLVQLLARHRCYSVAIGIESGSERVRKEILNRNYTNETLINISKMLHKAGIKFRTYNIIGLPGETEKELQETIDLNIAMKADFPRGAIFTPFPGTKIVESAMAQGYIGPEFSFDDIPNSILSHSVLKLDNSKQIQNILYFFQSSIIFPGLRPLFRALTKRPVNFLFRAWFYLVYAYLHRKSEKRNLFSYLGYVFANRGNL